MVYTHLIGERSQRRLKSNLEHYPLNGNGEMTGTAWIDESGWLAGPVMLTNTNSVGIVRDAVVAWGQREGWDALWSLPVMAEIYDGFLNDR